MIKILYVLKYIILLSTILFVKKSIEDLIITPNYRRFYYKIMNFHQTDYAYLGTTECCGGNNATLGACSTPCARYAKVTLQDSVSFKRDLQDEVFEPNGVFLMDVLVLNDTNPIVFKSPLKLKVEILDDLNDRVILSFVRENILLSQNSEKYFALEKFTGSGSFDAFMSFRCDGYVGYNCQYFCDRSNPKIDCEFTTGKVMCKNGKRNPPTCTNETASCDPSPCLNNGVCELTKFGTTICRCTPDFEGVYCETKIIIKHCDEDNTLSVESNKCICRDGFTGLECQIAVCNNYDKCKNNGVCIIDDNIHHCRCNYYNYSGRFCEYECNPGCLNGGCYYNGKTTLCICDNGYDGPICDKSVPMFVLASDSDAYTQNIRIAIGVGVACGLVVYAALVIGIIAYLKHRYTLRNAIHNHSGLAMSNLSTQLANGQKINSNSRL